MPQPENRNRDQRGGYLLKNKRLIRLTFSNNISMNINRTITFAYRALFIFFPKIHQTTVRPRQEILTSHTQTRKGCMRSNCIFLCDILCILVLTLSLLKTEEVQTNIQLRKLKRWSLLEYWSFLSRTQSNRLAPKS